MPSKFISDKRKKLIDAYYANKIKDVEVLIDNVWDPHNVAALARSADGLGIEKIHLYYTYNAFPNLKKVGKKSSSSANKWIRFERIEDIKGFLTQRKKEGWSIIGAAAGKEAKRLDRFVFPEKCLLVFGAEHGGISPEIASECDAFVVIPMVGMVESFNISVAAAIIMYEVFRQKGSNLRLRKGLF